MYFVYILYSASLKRYYVGTTDNTLKRLEEHNNNKYANSYTSKGILCELKLSFSYDSSTKAYQLENFIKRMKSKVFIEKVIKNPEILEEIIAKL